MHDRVLKIFCDTNRVCELEDSVVEWYDQKYFSRQAELVDLSIFEELFEIKGYMCAGVDGIISKIHLQAKAEGKYFIKFYFLGRLDSDYIGTPLVVKGKVASKKVYDMDGDENVSSVAIIHEVKRLGLLIDRYVDMEMRIGDQLIIYISKS